MKKVFLTINDEGYSRSWTYFAGLKKLNEDVYFVKLSPSHLIKDFLSLRSKFSRECIFVVMSPSHYLTFFTRVFLGKKIILDAGWSLTEASLISRRSFGLFGINVIKLYLIDFISCHIAKNIILESEQQRKFYTKIFFISRKKTSFIYTGVDEIQYFSSNKFKSPPDYFNNSKIVLFRGKYSREAGLEVLAEATLLLKDESITFWIFCPGLKNKLHFSSNCFISTEYIPSKNIIFELLLASSISLGQLSNHSRLNRTIPHKAFEAAYASKPYLTSRSSGIKELFIEGSEIECFEPGDAFDLANKIKFLLHDTEKLSQISFNMNQKYNIKCSQDKLTDELLKIFNIF
jgi:glycosyltransferase involved in cell wall biosynthesis